MQINLSKDFYENKFFRSATNITGQRASYSW